MKDSCYNRGAKQRRLRPEIDRRAIQKHPNYSVTKVIESGVALKIQKSQVTLDEEHGSHLLQVKLEFGQNLQLQLNNFLFKVSVFKFSRYFL